MSVLDKFLNAMKLNDDDGFEEEDYLDDDYEEDYEEERPRKRILSRREEEDSYEEPPRQAAEPKAEKASSSRSKQKTSRSSKISPIRPRKNSGGMEVCVIRPKSMEDAREITETLLDECTVVLNMEGLDLDIAQRIIDFASGSCFAIHGSLQKISNYIFIITPESVDISGDFQEILNGAFDVPAFGARF